MNGALTYGLMAVLYLTPFWTWINLRTLDRIGVTRKLIAFPLSLLLLAFYLSEYLYFAYPIYVGFFMAVYLLAEYMGADRPKCFSLGIYASFALSECWELPIHFMNWLAIGFEGATIGLLFSVCRLIALPLFFLSLDRGFRVKETGIFFLMLALYGFIMLFVTDYFIAHFYRLLWIIFFLKMISISNLDSKK